MLVHVDASLFKDIVDLQLILNEAIQHKLAHGKVDAAWNFSLVEVFLRSSVDNLVRLLAFKQSLDLLVCRNKLWNSCVLKIFVVGRSDLSFHNLSLIVSEVVHPRGSSAVEDPDI